MSKPDNLVQMPKFREACIRCSMLCPDPAHRDLPRRVSATT